jgi:hypothetical protein
MPCLCGLRTPSITASSLIEAAAHEDANIIFGSVIDPNLSEEIRITVIATGFDHHAKQGAVPSEPHPRLSQPMAVPTVTSRRTSAPQGPGQIGRPQGSDTAGNDQGDATALQMGGAQGHVMVADRRGLGPAEIPVVKAGGHGRGPAGGAVVSPSCRLDQPREPDHRLEADARTIWANQPATINPLLCPFEVGLDGHGAESVPDGCAASDGQQARNRWNRADANSNGEGESGRCHSMILTSITSTSITSTAWSGPIGAPSHGADARRPSSAAANSPRRRVIR